MEKAEAASEGARQITFAAMATTLSIIAIFLPVAFMRGVVGKFFYQFGMALSVAVGISLLEALTFTPMRCSQFLNIQEPRGLSGMAARGLQRLGQFYRGGLARALRHRILVFVVAVSFFFVSLFVIRWLNKEFVPPQDQSMFFLRLQTPPGSSIELTDQKFREAEAFIMSRPEVLRYMAAIGGFGGGEVNSGQLFVSLKEPHERPITAPHTKRPTQKDIMDHFRKELKKIEDLKVVVQDPSTSGLSSSRGFPVEMTVVGPSWEKLAEISETIQEKMKASPFFSDVDSNYQQGVTEIRVFPDRIKASERAVAIDDIARTINALVAGERVGKYTQNGRRYDVRIRLIPSQRAQVDDIKELWVWNNFGEMVQLKDVITIQEQETPLTITRENRERAIKIYSNVASDQSQSAAVGEAIRLAEGSLLEGYRIDFGGNTRTFQESFSSLHVVLWLGVIIAYMVLASQFNNYLDPLTILFALPFSVSGALIALWVTHQSLNIYSFIGIVLLMGIVKKNSILLVEFANQLRADGQSVTEALLQSGQVRLRPIIMTSLSTIAAAVPPAMSWGPGSEVLRPMAIVVIGGMILSTMLTIFVIPCVYSLLARGRRK
jgi:HAE1 family hydrophobic/amphiphilic exporter-1